MAFTTTRGESGVDFIGTDGVDALFALNESGVKTVDAKGGNDTVDLFDESGVVGTAEVKLGEGNDIFTMGANSTITNRLSESTVNGGPGNDNITTEGTLTTKLRGNEGDDDFFLLSNYTGTTINGNSGQDSYTITALAGATAANPNIVVLSDTKILGGSGNDGQMDFDNNAAGADTDYLRAVDSVIQGGTGLDTISIGDLAVGTTNFRVSGGADNDTINVRNTIAAADGVAYNGAAGEDSINFDDLNDADATTKGGTENDRITIGEGDGAITALGEDGNDTFLLQTVQGAAASTGGKHTITGGAGADAYSFETAGLGTDREALTFVINSVSESPATLTGTAATFDSFTDSATGAVINNAGFGDIIDMRGGSGEELVGNRLNADEVAVNLPLANIATAATFADVKAALDGTLTASDSNVGGSNTGRISLQLVEVTAGAVAGYYAILNNTNTILDSGDMMLGMATPVTGVADANDAAANTELGEIAAAIEAGFALV